MATQRQTQREKSFVIVDFLEIDTSCISFGPAKENKYKGLMIPIKYNGKNLYVRYPRTIAPFGIGQNTEMGNDQNVTGYTLSLSFGKDYLEDAVYKKAQELDEFFMDKCHENSLPWGLGKNLPRDRLEGLDEYGDKGIWKRLVKWSSRINPQTKEKIYNLDYPPRMEIAVPAVLTEAPTDENPFNKDSRFTSTFFDESGNKFSGVDGDNYTEVCPKFSDVSTLASWPRLTQGSYGITMKPQSKQLRVYPREELPNDECLLGEEGGEDNDELGDDALDGEVRQLTSVPVPSADDEGDDGVVVEYGDEVVEEEVVAPKPVKRVVRKVVKKN